MKCSYWIWQCVAKTTFASSPTHPANEIYTRGVVQCIALYVHTILKTNTWYLHEANQRGGIRWHQPRRQ